MASLMIPKNQQNATGLMGVVLRKCTGMMNVIREFLKANLLFDTSEHSSQLGEGKWLKEACTSKGIESYKHVNVQVSMARVSKLFSVRNFFLWGVLVSTKIMGSPCFPFHKFRLHRRHLPDKSVGLSLCILMVLLSYISPCFSPKKTTLDGMTQGIVLCLLCLHTFYNFPVRKKTL